VSVGSDPEIEHLEAELRASQFERWDVEKLLIERHEARIAALEKPRADWRRWWQVTKEISFSICAFVGYLTIITSAGVWFVSGDLPVIGLGQP
jgi:hypothetical protein